MTGMRKPMPWSARIGLGVIVVMLACALFAPWLAPHDPYRTVAEPWAPGFWDAEHTPQDVHAWLGTDHLGRDLLTRLIHGARNSVAIALATTTLSFAVGILGGLVAAVRRGWLDQILSRGVDILMGFPMLIFALLLLAVLGTSIPILIGVIALLDATRVFRITRAVAMDLEAQDFVEIARLRGEGTAWIMLREVLPNAVAPLAAEFGLRFCFVFLFIATLSFLGLGIQPPLADWGSMVRENAAAISFGILTPLFPAGAIAVLTIAVNLVIDWFAEHGRGRDE